MVLPVIGVDKLNSCPLKLSTTAYNSSYPVFTGIDPVLIKLKNIKVQNLDSGLGVKLNQYSGDSLSPCQISVLESALMDAGHKASKKIEIQEFDYDSSKSTKLHLDQSVQYFGQDGSQISREEMTKINLGKVSLVVQLESLVVDYNQFSYWWHLRIWQIKVEHQRRLPDICLLENIDFDDN